MVGPRFQIVGIRDTTRFPLYETREHPDPDECIGMAGLTISLVIAVIGLTWLLVYQGGLASFGLVILAAFVGWVPFMYRES